MSKHQKILAVIKGTLPDEGKAAVIVTLLNKSTDLVVEDLFNALSMGGLLTDTTKAKGIKDSLAGQATKDDYPKI